MTEPAAPALSVVVPSVNGWGDLEGCLEALAGQEGVDLEVVVVDRVGSPVRDRIAQYPLAVELIEVEPLTTIPRMRELAFDRVRAPIVGVIEDHVIVPPDWSKKMLAAHEAGEQVVGGSVDNAARGTVAEWASFLCEYSHCLSPEPGASDWVTGNNVTYRRELLEKHRDVIALGGWENLLHDAIRDSGVDLVCRPEIGVGHKKHFTFGEYMSQRYLYARSYAGARLAGAGLPRRLVYALATLALPPVLALRIVRGVLASGRYRPELIRSIPMIGLFVFAWAGGETVGALAGPGDALGRVC